MRLQLTWAQELHLGLVRRLMPAMNRLIRASPDAAEAYVSFVTVDVRQVDAMLEVRLFYIAAVVGAWVVAAFACVGAMFVVGIPAETFGEKVQDWVLALLASAIAACAAPGVASPWFHRQARKAAREASHPGADPARIRRLAGRAMPGGGLLLVQGVVALFALSVSLSD